VPKTTTSGARGPRRGTDRERAFRKWLEARGYITIKSGGSRGPSDIWAMPKVGEVVQNIVPDGLPVEHLAPTVYWCQVKSASDPMTRAEQAELQARAHPFGAVAVHVVDRGRRRKKTQHRYYVEIIGT